MVIYRLIVFFVTTSVVTKVVAAVGFQKNLNKYLKENSTIYNKHGLLPLHRSMSWWQQNQVKPLNLGCQSIVKTTACCYAKNNICYR